MEGRGEGREWKGGGGEGVEGRGRGGSGREGEGREWKGRCREGREWKGGGRGGSGREGGEGEGGEGVGRGREWMEYVVMIVVCVSSYTDFDRQVDLKLKYKSITALVEHPISFLPPGEPRVAPLMPLILTKQVRVGWMCRCEGREGHGWVGEQRRE